MGASLEKWPEVTGKCGQDRAALQWALERRSKPQGLAGVLLQKAPGLSLKKKNGRPEA